MIPNGDFAVSHDLQSATLGTTLTEDRACGGYGSPIGGGKDAVFAGGNSGLVLPITINVRWTATGAITTYKNSFSVRCLDYSQEASSTVSSTAAGANGSISALPGPFGAEFSTVSDSRGQFDIHNEPQAACLGYGSLSRPAPSRRRPPLTAHTNRHRLAPKTSIHCSDRHV